METQQRTHGKCCMKTKNKNSLRSCTSYALSELWPLWGHECFTGSILDESRQFVQVKFSLSNTRNVTWRVLWTFDSVFKTLAESDRPRSLTAAPSHSIWVYIHGDSRTRFGSKHIAFQFAHWKKLKTKLKQIFSAVWASEACPVSALGIKPLLFYLTWQRDRFVSFSSSLWIRRMSFFMSVCLSFGRDSGSRGVEEEQGGVKASTHKEDGDDRMKKTDLRDEKRQKGLRCLTCSLHHHLHHLPLPQRGSHWVCLHAPE